MTDAPRRTSSSASRGSSLRDGGQSLRGAGQSLRDSASATGVMAPILALLERALNDALRYDPATKQRLAAHKGRVLAIECLQPPVNAYFLFTADGVEIYDACETEVDATIRAGAIGLLRQLASERPDVAPAGGDIAVGGDTRFVQDIVKIARDVNIDWEEPLARILGDVAARQVGDLLRGAASFMFRAATSLKRNGEDYLRHELAIFPSKHAMREFLRDVDDLRLDTDRIAARLAAARARVDALAAKKA
ncbi:MAG: SCP2 domain-containing protein [Gammaproteobacteria bacterium]